MAARLAKRAAALDQAVAETPGTVEQNGQTPSSVPT
jgi:hypothetical protein